MSYNPNLPAGRAAAASSAPVALSSEDISDAYITGAASQSAAGNNVLLASAGTGGIDCMPASGIPFRSFAVQINGSAGISAGAITFEQSNDNTNWNVASYFVDNSYGSASVTPTTIAASTNYFFSGRIGCRYLRCRISTGVTGGTVQAFTRLSPADLTRVTQVQTASANFGLVTATPATGTSYSALTTASTNAAVVKASAGSLYELAISNPTATPAYVKFYNKASAPTVGTDVPVLVIPAAANSAVSFPFGAIGKRFATGIAIATTGAIGDSDTTSAVAGVHIHGTYL